jgi:hypothetical protein
MRAALSILLLLTCCAATAAAQTAEQLVAKNTGAKGRVAKIPYFQKSRHIFGDLTIEIFDETGALVDTIAGSKRRGVNRATWSMRLKPPHVPPAAAAVGGTVVGPRVLPGTDTVRMTTGDQRYTTTIKVALDPRAGATLEDRQAQIVAT